MRAGGGGDMERGKIGKWGENFKPNGVSSEQNKGALLVNGNYL